MANLIQVKRGLAASLPTLAAGEPAFTTDNYDYYIGDGTTNHKINSEEDFTTTLKDKLDGVEALADVTDFTNVLAALAAATSAVDFNGQKITGLGTPDNPSDAVPKSYADSISAGLDPKESVRVASTANIDLSTGGELTIDGIATSAGDRVLVKDQTTASQNGIYVVATGAWSRSADADVDSEVTAGMFCFVEEGTVNADRGYILSTDDPITLDTTSLTFSKFAALNATGAFTDLSDTPASITADYIVKGNGAGTALEMVDFAGTYLDDTAGGTDALTTKAATSNILYDHAVATSGVHGAGANTLLHSASTIDGGSF